MIKRIKPAFLLFIQFLLVQGIYGQTPISITDNITDKFTRFIKSVPREEIYVHSDRDEYMSGENVWFNVYLIDRVSAKTSTDSKIAYFELLNHENRPIIQKKIFLVNGAGPGDIILPDTLSTGVYTIRAYTNWMKNFLPYNCFIKEINVYNAFSDRIIKTRRNQTIQMSTAAINEDAQRTGLTFTVDNLKSESVEIIVNSTEKYRTENNNLCYLFIHTHGIINRCSSERLTGESTRITIARGQLSSGINQITIFTSAGKQAGDRFIYTPSQNKSAAIIHSADSLLQRNKFSLDVDFQGKSGHDCQYSISVSPKTNNKSVLNLSDYMVFGSEFGLLPANMIGGRKLSDVRPSYLDSLLLKTSSNWINWNIILADQLPVYQYQLEQEDTYLNGRLISGETKMGDPDKYVLLSSPGKAAVFQYAKTDENGNFSFNIHIDGNVKDLIIQPDQVNKKNSINIESPFSDKFLRLEKQPDSESRQLPRYISSWSINHQVTKIYGESSSGTPGTYSIPVPKKRRFYGKPDNDLLLKDYIALPVMQEVFFELLAGVSLKNKKGAWELTINDPLNNRPYEVTPGLFVDGVKINDPSIIAGLDPELVEKIEVVREKYFVGDYKFYGVVNIITKAGDFSNVNMPDYAIRLPYRAIDPVSSFTSPQYTSAESKKNHVPDFRNTLYWNPSVKPGIDGKASCDFWSSDFVTDYEINIDGFTMDGNPFSASKVIKVKR